MSDDQVERAQLRKSGPANEEIAVFLVPHPDTNEETFLHALEVVNAANVTKFSNDLYSASLTRVALEQIEQHAAIEAKKTMQLR